MSFTSSERRELAIVAGCTAVSFAGDFMADTSLVLTLQHNGAAGYAVAALLIAGVAPAVLLAPLAGRLVDRFRTRPLLVTVAAIQAMVCVALAYLRQPALIIALMALVASGLAITGPAVNAIVPRAVDRDRIPQAQAVVQTVRGIGILAGPALAGILVGRFGQTVPLLIDAISFLAVIAAGLLLRTAHGGGPLRRDADTGRVRGGVSLVRADRLLTIALVLIAVGITAVTCDNVGEVYLVRETLHGSSSAYGLLSALWSAAAIVGSWLLGRRAPGDRGVVRLLLLLLGVFGLVMLGLAAAPTVPWLIPVYLVGGLANGGLNLSIGVLLARRVRSDERGRVGATFNAFINGGTLIGYGVGGGLLSVVSPRILFTGSGLLSLTVIGVLTVPVLAALRRAPETRDAVPTVPLAEPAAS
jgi:MFS family permease